MNFMLRMIVRSYSFVNLLSGLIFFLIFNKFAKFLYCRLLLLGRILFPVRVKNFGLFFFLSFFLSLFSQYLEKSHMCYSSRLMI